jgi:hypothetical protein
MDDKVVKIPLSIFKSRYHIDVPEHILQKAETLKKSCSCFESFYDPKMIWEKKLYNKREKQHSQYQSHQPQYQQQHLHQPQYQHQHSHNNQYNAGTTPVAPVATASNKGRFHIIIPDFSDNSSTKRALIGYLNKLTMKNRDVIYEKIKAIIDMNNTEELFLIICSYIKATEVSDGNLYITLLDYFDSTFLNDLMNKLWDNYITKKEWIPPKFIFDNNLLLLNNEYELYCDYVKWKKGIHNTNIIWAKYKPREMQRLLNDIYDYLVEECIGNPRIHKYIIDIFFEQILKILKGSFDKSIVEKIKSLDIKSFDSSTKFLIYAIIENK